MTLKGLVAIIFVLGSFNGCSVAKNGGTTTGNPVVAMSFAGFNDTAPAGKVSAYSTVQALTLCFKRLRFRGDNISEADFDIGEIELDPAGTALASARVPEGVYTRIEFDLESTCAGGNSIRVTNAHGTFSTTETITIRFEGSYPVTEELQDLTLFLASILSSLEAVTLDSQIRDAAQAAAGDF